MDAPAAETLLESSSHAGQERNKLPELSRSQTTLSATDSSYFHPSSPLPSPSVPVSPALSPALRKQKSLRTRPAEALQRQHAAPLSPLNDRPVTPSRQPKPKVSKMSLFNLFSKPKVEKSRGWAEPGLEAPSRALSNGDADQSPDIVVRVADADAQNGKVRPTTSKSYSSKGLRAMPSMETLPPTLSTDRRLRPFEPPPLFQVWPQAIKHGKFEITIVSPEMVLQKSKNRMMGATLAVPGGDIQSLRMAGNRDSVESRTTVKSALRHVANGSISGVNLPTKIFVLSTSGCLLQYAESGPSDRPPERILQLGRNSAAYASDLIPGKHHVLQIEQAVDQDGTVVANSHSFLSKLGIRSNTARRMTPNFLVVMPGPLEMDDWMTTIRREIERLGGKRARSDSATSRMVRPKTGEAPKPQIDLRSTPSLSHRYRVKRSPSIPTIPSPAVESKEHFPSVQPTHVEEENEKIETTKTEDDEQEQSGTEEHPRTTRPRKTSDVPSISSSTGVSVDQQKLDKLRDSSRISHSTVATTIASSISRTNSMSSTPPSEFKDLLEGQQEVAIVKSPYRSLSSYSLATKRRSAALLVLQEPPVPEVGKSTSIPDHHKKALAEAPVDSPILGRHPTSPEPSPGMAKKNLSESRSVPNLRTADAIKHDSKIPVPPMADAAERPESFVGDLPDPTTWASKTSPGSRNPLFYGHANSDTLAQRAAEGSSMTRPLRAGSHSFSLPLRVNPQDPSSQRPVIKRTSQSADTANGIRSPIPAATTLVAKVDFTTRTKIDICNIPRRKSSTKSSPPRDATEQAQSRKRGSSTRLSLFPSANAPPGPPPGLPLPAPPIQRSPSVAGMNGLAAHPPSNGTALRRPSSLQVRADHAPFLSSIRVSPVAGPGQIRATTTVPIRSLKPSRSVATMQTVYQGAAMPPQSFNFNACDKLNAEAMDEARPLPLRSESPPKDAIGIPLPPSRPSSRTRRCRTSASLPELDFGMPLIGLGPPAPPPQAPLPQLPTESRPGSRAEGPVMRTGTPIGIGIAIGEAVEEEPAGGVPVGLGIEVS